MARTVKELKEQYVNGIIRLRMPRNRAPIAAVRDADLVIDMQGKVIKDRYGTTGRHASNIEKDAAEDVR
jgi:hypothetical protein